MAATEILGALVLVVTLLGTYYANGLKSALEGSELANVWKYVGIGVILLLVGAIAGGAANNGIILPPSQALDTVLFFTVLSALALTNGLRIQLEKVK